MRPMRKLEPEHIAPESQRAFKIRDRDARVVGGNNVERHKKENVERPRLLRKATEIRCDYLAVIANHLGNDFKSSLQMQTCLPAMALKVHDEEIFLRLIEQHRGIIRKVAAGYSSTLTDQHDLTQEIMLQLWKAYPRFSPERAFSTWMYRIALNVAISFLRKNTRPVRQTIPLDEIGTELADESAGTPEADDRIAILQRLIAMLDPLNRALLLLYLDDHSYGEIAAILGITETNVATKLSRLKERLRQNVTKNRE
jgi:RNA polymerase sigma-70 factor (ECF subfamily)